MRLVWTIDAGLPRPLCNVTIFDLDGRHIGTPDLFDPVVGLVGEYDGALHLAGSQRAHDDHREAAFRAAGLECVVMLGADRADTSRFVFRLVAAHHRAALDARPPGWTMQPPPWWTPTDTVERRRALAADKRFLLNHRRLSG